MLEQVLEGWEKYLTKVCNFAVSFCMLELFGSHSKCSSALHVLEQLLNPTVQ